MSESFVLLFSKALYGANAPVALANHFEQKYSLFLENVCKPIHLQGLIYLDNILKYLERKYSLGATNE